MADIAYGGFLGLFGCTEDSATTIKVDDADGPFTPITVEMHRAILNGLIVDPLNTEWDKYTLIEKWDPSGVGSATLGNGKGDTNQWQPDGTPGQNQNDWQHDTFKFELDTSSDAWKNLAYGKSVSVSYQISAFEYNACGEVIDSDTLRIDFTFIKTCFAGDAMIRMADGSDKRADAIVVGDLIATLDNGAQPVRWVGRNPVMAAEMKHFAQWRPVRIAAGALGAGRPAADLVVSQLHRVLVEGPVAQRFFGAAQVLVPARFLTDIEGVEIVADAADLTYVHFMFDNHEVVWANGVRAESFYVSPLSRSQIGAAQLAELEGLFPELARMVREGTPAPARQFARGPMARTMAKTFKAQGLPLQ